MIDERSRSQYGLDMQVSPGPMAVPDRTVGNLGAESSKLIFCRA
jgi:hypothetical protein